MFCVNPSNNKKLRQICGRNRVDSLADARRSKQVKRFLVCSEFSNLIFKSGIIIPRIIKSTLPSKAKDVIIQDAIQRDITTARRTALLEILWNERYPTRAQLIARVELRLGRKCFGSSAWLDTFYRDMRVVKQAYKVTGFPVLYSRDCGQPGYYLQGQETLSSDFKQILKSSGDEVDQRQIDIYNKLSPADRSRQGSSISDISRNVVTYRIRQENPKLSSDEANQLALQRVYRP